MNTNSYGGKKLRKAITVQTNDKNNPTARLEITGKIERFARILPSSVSLSGFPGKSIVRVVMITPMEKYPFSVTEAKALYGKNISFELDKATDPPEKGYVLRIENTRKEKGRYKDTIVLKTTSKIKPELKIKVYGNIFDLKSGPPVQNGQNLQKFLDSVKKEQQEKPKSGGAEVEQKAAPKDIKNFLEQLGKQGQGKQNQEKPKNPVTGQ